MSVRCAEYYGQRTDVDAPTIRPELRADAPCPFTSGMACSKLSSSKHYPPVCSVRQEDGTLWIVCPDRLCSTKKDYAICAHQREILLQIGHAIYGEDVGPADICVKREVNIPKGDGRPYHADYVMSLRSGRSEHAGPDRLIVEMQGGGETQNTGILTRAMREWERLEAPSNERLRTKVDKVGPLVTNAWRRQQEQFIVKGNTAMNTWKGYGIAFCVGTLLYDYLMDKLRDNKLPPLQHNNWTLAVFAFMEDRAAGKTAGPVPLKLDPERRLYTNYQTFVQALINQGSPAIEAFTGRFVNLLNEEVNIPNP